MNQTVVRDTNTERGSQPPPFRMRALIMISVIPTDIIWLAVIVAMVMAGFLAATPE
jgi:hypothetical protein